MMMTSEPVRRRKSQPMRALLLFSQPTVLVLALVVIFMQWRVATMLQVEMIAALPAGDFSEARLHARVASGEFFPAEVRQLAIRYPEYPTKREKVSTAAGKLVLVPVEALVIRAFTSDDARQEFRLVLEGLAEQAYLTQADQLREDYRLTLFDKVTHSSIALGSGIMIWLFLTALGWIKVYRELKRYL